MSLSQKFHYSAKMVEQIARISEIMGYIQAQSISSQHWSELASRSQAASTHFSTKIEGNPLTLQQVTTVLDELRLKKTKKTPTQRSLKEVINYAKTRQFVSSESCILNEVNLLKSHEIILNGIVTKPLRGHYRNSQNAIKEAKSGQVVYLPPEWTDVQPLMRELLKGTAKNKITKEISSLIFSGIFHFHFESIHPFNDGNGRLGRLWSFHILLKSGFDFVLLAALEKYHEKNRTTYYEILHYLQGDIFYNISSDIDLTPWIEYWISSLLKTAEEAVSTLEQKVVIISDEDNVAYESIELALSLFRRHNKLSAQELQDLMGLGRTHTVEKINYLLAQKLIKKIGGGRSTRYVLIKNK